MFGVWHNRPIVHLNRNQQAQKGFCLNLNNEGFINMTTYYKNIHVIPFSSSPYIIPLILEANQRTPPSESSNTVFEGEIASSMCWRHSFNSCLCTLTRTSE
jgi:hypothetical protein